MFHSQIDHFAIPIMTNRFQVLSDQSMLGDSLQLQPGNDTVDTVFTEDNIHQTKPQQTSKTSRKIINYKLLGLKESMFRLSEVSPTEWPKFGFSL